MHLNVRELEFKISNLSKGFTQSRNQSVNKVLPSNSLITELSIFFHLLYTQKLLRWLW